MSLKNALAGKIVAALDMKKLALKTLVFLGFFWSFVLLFVISNVVQGLVLSCLWQWFAVPLGAQHLNWIHAIGLSVLFDFVTYHYYDYKKSEEVGVITALQYVIIRPVIAFGIGYGIHLIM